MLVNIKCLPKSHLPTYLLFLICTLGVFTLNGQENALLWDKANNFYSQKQYDSAVTYYTLLLPGNENNPVLHYNLGNANYRLNQIGEAVLHYEKAVHLDPGNKQAKDNLILAKARILNPLPEVSPIFFVRWWEQLLQLFSANTWAFFTILTFVSFIVLIYYTRSRKENFANSGRWLSVSIVLLLLCGCMTWFTYDAATNSGKAVVLNTAATLLETPQLSGKVMSSLPEGTVVEIFSRQNGFLNVKLPNGRMGWVKETTVGEV